MEKTVKAPAPRRWWLAGILSLLLPGWGQVYNGQIKKGVLFFFIGNIVSVVPLLLIVNYPSKATFVMAFVLLCLIVLFIVIDAALTSKRIGNNFIQTVRPLFIYFLIVCGFMLAPTMRTLVKHHIVQAYKLPSATMEPTLLVGDHILADKMSNNPRRGDIVVFDYQNKTFIKRVVAIPGDIVEIRDKNLYINGNPMVEKYIVHLDNEIVPQRDNITPMRVPPDSYFVLGDNRDKSYDSRFWGFVLRSKIGGVARAIYWSWDGVNGKIRWERIGEAVK